MNVADIRFSNPQEYFVLSEKHAKEKQVVMPAHAGIHFSAGCQAGLPRFKRAGILGKAAVLPDGKTWIPTYAGMTKFFLTTHTSPAIQIKYAAFSGQ